MNGTVLAPWHRAGCHWNPQGHLCIAACPPFSVPCTALVLLHQCGPDVTTVGWTHVCPCTNWGWHQRVRLGPRSWGHYLGYFGLQHPAGRDTRAAGGEDGKPGLGSPGLQDTGYTMQPTLSHGLPEITRFCHDSLPPPVPGVGRALRSLG